MVLPLFDLLDESVYKSEKNTLIQNLKIPVIAIDGGAGTGKGTVRRIIAWVLKFLSLDSGVLYRAVAFKAKCLNVSFSNEAVLVQIAKNLKVEAVDSRILLDGVDRTKELRSDETGKGASQVARSVNVRLALRNLQLNMRKYPGLVADGRDQCSIFDTPYRFFLKASAEERARRRVLQFSEKKTYDEVLEEILRRDKSDEENPANHLKPHPDAVVIDTTKITAKEVARLIIISCQLKSLASH